MEYEKNYLLKQSAFKNIASVNVHALEHTVTETLYVGLTLINLRLIVCQLWIVINDSQ